MALGSSSAVSKLKHGYLRRELGLREVGVVRCCCCPNRGVPKAPPGEGATVPNRPPGEATGAPACSGDAPNIAVVCPAGVWGQGSVELGHSESSMQASASNNTATNGQHGLHTCPRAPRTCGQRLHAVLLLRGLQRGGLRCGAARLVLGMLLLPPRLLHERVAAVAQRSLAGEVGLACAAHPVVQRLKGEGQGRVGEWAMGQEGGAGSCVGEDASARGWGGSRAGGGAASPHATMCHGQPDMCPNTASNQPPHPGVTCSLAAVWMSRSCTLVSAVCSACRPSWPPLRRCAPDGQESGEAGRLVSVAVPD